MLFQHWVGVNPSDLSGEVRRKVYAGPIVCHRHRQGGEQSG